MRRKGNKDTTICYQFRTLRATFNRAITAKVVSKEKNPFSEFKLSHLNTKTIKRALSKTDILKIMDADCHNKSELSQLAHDLFCFSYLCGGISLVDMANLTPENIMEGRLIYQRQKTHGSINLQLSDRALKIISKYSDYQKKAYFFFPILHCKRHVTPMQKHNRVRKYCLHINHELKQLAKELNITANVTTYVARHSFATILKKSGVNIGIISQALGHQDIKTTQIYLSKFDNEQDEIYLDNLKVNDGDLKISPNFNKKITSYTLDVEESTDSIIVKGDTEYDANIVKINGSTADSKNRKRVHECAMKKNKHRNIKLQRAVN